MKTFPLESITLEEAKRLQFKLVDIITRHFRGADILSLGDLGVVAGLNKPSATLRVEETLADFFEQEAAVLVRGAGTAAIRWGLYSTIKPGENLLVHDAPIYNTTAVSVESMGLNVIYADFNNIEAVKRTMVNNKINGVLIQHTRQKMNDSYNMGEVIASIRRAAPSVPIISDDNYAVAKVKNIGAGLGADLSAFSMFKLLGPEGIGCIVGKEKYISKVIKANYSGGGQVQGYEALEALRGLVYAPVAFALQAEVNNEVVNRLNAGEVKGVKSAFLANAQSKIILVEFEKAIAKRVLEEAEKLGAAPNPVGAESKYEIAPMFYRISGTFRDTDHTLEAKMIRINPMRCGADTIIRILEESLAKAL